jgi:hypothetical protein
MVSRTRIVLVALVVMTVSNGLASAAPRKLENGGELHSVGAIAFGPNNVLFVADPQAAAIFAFEIKDQGTAAGPVKVESLDGKLASLLGTTERGIAVNAIAVNPTTGNVFLSVTHNSSPAGSGFIFRVGRDGKIEEVDLAKSKHTRTELTKASDKSRKDSITHMAFVDGKLLVAGLSNEEFSSRFRAIAYPFDKNDTGTNVEIFHGSHGRLETNSPVRTFTPYAAHGEENILAAYTCTPLVKIEIGELKPGAKVKGKTVAELGNMNVPLDMIIYQKDGKDYALMANSRRGVMKVSLENIDKVEPIVAHVRDKAGLTYETVAGLKGVQHLDRLDKDNVVLLVMTPETKALSLETVPLP